MEEILDFLRDIRDNNNREWFHAHHKEYKHAAALFGAFAERLIEGIASFDSSIGRLSVRDCTYRFARDTRFSADKTPYKSHFGAFVAPHGARSGYAGYYLHIEPGKSILSSGIYCPEPVVLRSIREEVMDNGDGMKEAIRRSGFELDRSNTLKRNPQGFPSATPHDDLLRLKDFYVSKPIDTAFVLSDGFLERTLEEFDRTREWITILNRAVQYAFEEMK